MDKFTFFVNVTYMGPGSFLVFQVWDTTTSAPVRWRWEGIWPGWRFSRSARTETAAWLCPQTVSCTDGATLNTCSWPRSLRPHRWGGLTAEIQAADTAAHRQGHYSRMASYPTDIHRHWALVYPRSFRSTLLDAFLWKAAERWFRRRVEARRWRFLTVSAHIHLETWFRCRQTVFELHQQPLRNKHFLTW